MPVIIAITLAGQLSYSMLGKLSNIIQQLSFLVDGMCHICQIIGVLQKHCFIILNGCSLLSKGKRITSLTHSQFSVTIFDVFAAHQSSSVLEALQIIVSNVSLFQLAAQGNYNN